MSMPGTWEWIIILAIVLVFFGGSKLPKLGGAIGESIKNFKKGLSSGTGDDKARQELSKDKDREGVREKASDKENV